jgi:hypothetical protein
VDGLEELKCEGALLWVGEYFVWREDCTDGTLGSQGGLCSVGLVS